ncbi:MAG: argininosuccinate lyase, partial [SAR202 cluster bacterium]|nr:argininosuccinate lyase [SAR202 cluster bacterium]
MADYTTHHFKSLSRYTVSVGYDQRLYPHDIAGSIAHARMLGRQGIVSQADADAIVRGLEQVKAEIDAGAFAWKPELEDLHMNIERRLHEIVGAAAGRLHTARSRNDQVATATRLFARDAIARTVALLRQAQAALLAQAEAHPDTLLPGYTHLQRAQPVLLAHHLLAYFEMFDRDAARFADGLRRVNVLPLGSGALAGVPYPIDRESVARELGFEAISANSMDAVADRDYLAEFMANAAICAMHCSRLAEELVLWTSSEFGFARLAPEWVTGSSIMPQKRNPDFAELARGKTGRVYGNLVSLLTVLKGLPLTYNRDLQEDKEGFFDTVDTIEVTLEAMAGMLSTMTLVEQRMVAAAEDPSLLATDLADYLVGKGVPFREAHGIVSALCDEAMAKGVTLRGLSLDDYRARSPKFERDVYDVTAAASA